MLEIVLNKLFSVFKVYPFRISYHIITEQGDIELEVEERIQEDPSTDFYIIFKVLDESEFSQIVNVKDIRLSVFNSGEWVRFGDYSSSWETNTRYFETNIPQIYQGLIYGVEQT